MSKQYIGTTDHENLYNFETAFKRFRSMGIDELIAKRMAMFAMLRLSESCNTVEAWEIVNAIYPQYTTGDVTSPDNYPN